MELVGGEIRTNELSAKANGGSEQILKKLQEVGDPALLKEAQIINSRVRELDPDKVRILVCHDLPGDPESDHLRNGGWSRFHKIVFVSNWQMQQYVAHYGIPWEQCQVIQNAIVPIESGEKEWNPKEKLNLIYHTTPHRGLELLVPVFEKLKEKYPQLHLDVYSSFNLYGWPERDEQYKEVFEAVKTNESMTYHGAVPNSEVREALKKAHIFAYPSIWMETSCICLIEAMSAEVACVHPNLGALYETAANWTHMYQWSADKNKHANIFYEVMDGTIQAMIDAQEISGAESIKSYLESQKKYIDLFYSWEARKHQWNALIASQLDKPRVVVKPEGPMFVYRTG